MSVKSEIRKNAEAAIEAAGVRSYAPRVFVDTFKESRRVKFAGLFVNETNLVKIRKKFAKLYPDVDTRVRVIVNERAPYCNSGLAFSVFEEY